MAHNTICSQRSNNKPSINEFQIMKSGLNNNLFRKAYEALIIKKQKPPLNIQDDQFIKTLNIF